MRRLIQSKEIKQDLSVPAEHLEFLEGFFFPVDREDGSGRSVQNLSRDREDGGGHSVQNLTEIMFSNSNHIYSCLKTNVLHDKTFTCNKTNKRQ